MKSRYARKLFSLTILLTLWTLTVGRVRGDISYQDDSVCSAQYQAGRALYDEGQYSQALQSLWLALVCFQQAGNPLGEAEAFTSIGDVYEAQGRYDLALEMYQSARVRHQLAGNLAGEGTVLSAIGWVYMTQGRYTDALELCNQALTVHRIVGDQAGEAVTLYVIGRAYESMGDYAQALEVNKQAARAYREAGDRATEGDILNNIGILYDKQGYYAEALAMYQEALLIAQEVGDCDGEAITRRNIGEVYTRQGQFARALELFQLALSSFRETDNRAGEALCIHSLGWVYSYQGRYAEALARFQQALSIHREVGDRVAEGATLSGIGDVYSSLGRFDEALTMYRQALSIFREIGDRSQEADGLNNLAMLSEALGHHTTALEFHQQAMALYLELGDVLGEALCVANMGSVYQNQGRRAEALEKYQQALAIIQKIGDRINEVTVLHNIGSVYEEQGRHVEALEMYQQALRVSREVNDRVGEGIVLEHIAHIHFYQGEYDRALTSYQAAMDIVEGIRTTAGSEKNRASFAARYIDLYAEAVGLSHQLGLDQNAFFTSERGRARAFLDSLATGYVELTDEEMASQLARERETYASLQVARKVFADATASDTTDPSLMDELEAELADSEATYAKALADIATRGDQLAALVPGRSTVLPLLEVQSLLDEETTLLSYLVLDHQTLVFLVTHDHFETIEIQTSREALRDQIDGFRTIIGGRQAEATQRWSQDLYRLLIAPLSDSLQTSNLAIIPHDSLHYLPFAALQDPRTEQYLIEYHALTILPSASALPFIQENTGDKLGSLLVLGNPAIGDPKSGTLRFAEQEAKTLAALYDTQPVIGQAATESVLRKQSSQAGVIHLAAHGLYNSASPLHSAIALAPDDVHDGRLEVQEIYGLDLSRTDLVVLSACRTQLGEVSAGDEVVGLTRAFLFAGTPSIVATLWSVDDATTSQLMERFHIHLREGMSKADALRQAQLDLLKDYSAPYHWAGFVLSGDGGKLQISQQLPPWLTLIGGFLLVVLLAAVVSSLSFGFPVNRRSIRSAKER